MDRFIADDLIPGQQIQTNLKSSMDRFIAQR